MFLSGHCGEFPREICQVLLITIHVQQVLTGNQTFKLPCYFSISLYFPLEIQKWRIVFLLLFYMYSVPVSYSVAVLCRWLHLTLSLTCSLLFCLVFCSTSKCSTPEQLLSFWQWFLSEEPNHNKYLTIRLRAWVRGKKQNVWPKLLCCS